MLANSKNQLIGHLGTCTQLTGYVARQVRGPLWMGGRDLGQAEIWAKKSSEIWAKYRKN